MTAAVAVRLRHLRIRDFRNLAAADLPWPADGAVLVGANGHGKTNVLEAIHYGHALRAMRGAADRDAVHFGAPAFHLALDAEGARCHTLGIGAERASGRKKVTCDGTVVTRLVDAYAAIPSVVVSPRDADLVHGPPRDRRQYLDALLAATSPQYLTALQRYRTALAQRNAVLRGGDAAGRVAEVAAWDGPLAAAGAILWSARRAWVATWSLPFARYCAAIGEEVPQTMRHHTGHGDAIEASPDDLTGFLREALARGREDDVRRGSTQVGPHRDDLRLTHGGRSVRGFASAGQQRTIALALRLLEWETLCAELRVHPILLLDDPFAELDRSRVDRILAMLQGMNDVQRVLVVPRADEVPPGFTALERWSIRHGVIDVSG